MATGALVSIEDYLRTTYKSARDYVDGVLYLKSLPARKHGLIQTRLGQLINVGFPTFEAASEVTFQIRTGKHLVPDLIAQERGLIQDPHPTAPVHLCVEILSPEDRMSPVIAKCEEYHAWSRKRVDRVSRCSACMGIQEGQLPVEVALTAYLRASGISISTTDLFSVL